MIDLELDENFSVTLNDKNGISTVDGRSEFEQSVRVMVTHYMYQSVLGESDSEIIKSKIRLVISRVARRHDHLDDISDIQIRRSIENPHTYKVKINYESDSMSTFEVTE